MTLQEFVTKYGTLLDELGDLGVELRNLAAKRAATEGGETKR